MFANGEGPVFIESVKWLEDEDSRLQMAAVLAIGNFARNGQFLHFRSHLRLSQSPFITKYREWGSYCLDLLSFIRQPLSEVSGGGDRGTVIGDLERAPRSRGRHDVTTRHSKRSQKPSHTRYLKHALHQLPSSVTNISYHQRLPSSVTNVSYQHQLSSPVTKIIYQHHLPSLVTNIISLDDFYYHC